MRIALFNADECLDNDDGDRGRPTDPRATALTGRRGRPPSQAGGRRRLRDELGQGTVPSIKSDYLIHHAVACGGMRRIMTAKILKIMYLQATSEHFTQCPGTGVFLAFPSIKHC